MKALKVLIIIIMLVVPIAGIASLAATVEVSSLRWWAVGATLLLPVAFLVGLLIGGLEARGKLAGIDVAADKFTGSWERIARATAESERKRPAPTVQVYAPGNGAALLPPISHRRPVDEDEVIDL